MGRHIIIRNRPEGGHERLRGVFTDAQFDTLPWVKGYGAFPAGYAAVHFGDTDDSRDLIRDHAYALPLAAQAARPVLAALWRQANTRRWCVTIERWGTVHFPTERQANACLRSFREAWRGWHSYDGCGGRYSTQSQDGHRCCRLCHRYGHGRYTAIRYVVEGRLAFEFKVKHRRVTHGYVSRVDPRTITLPLAA